MRVTDEVLAYFKEYIEKHTAADPNITDVIITYQVKLTNEPKNFLKLDIKIK